ncbi:AAA family ATPase [Eisenibacter elegans]|uniref:AAA family ATPase n=1 Tax=Eisenibacter elegans TaxID=997 RepID=UPI000428472D|nr:AAA family ATPase [Eisenibacter elegans]
MRIINFQFEDKSLEWRLEPLTFNKLTLLVGASGVGKTQILRALMTLKQIAEGDAVNGITWRLEFETLTQQQYIWEGAFENKQSSTFSEFEDDKVSDKHKYTIITERLVLNGVDIVRRDIDSTSFRGQQIAFKLPKNKSVLYLLKEEDEIRGAQKIILKLHFSNQLGFAEDAGMYVNNQEVLTKIIASHNTLDKIISSKFKTSIKLLLASKAPKDTIFQRIKDCFISIFPTVVDLRVEMMKSFFSIAIKESGVDKWIALPRMSWGMVKTLKQLSELYLCEEGTVFLVDGFEDSLGVNCIDEITRDILISQRSLQFVLTSHHPPISWMPLAIRIGSLSHEMRV